MATPSRRTGSAIVRLLLGAAWSDGWAWRRGDLGKLTKLGAKPPPSVDGGCPATLRSRPTRGRKCAPLTVGHGHKIAWMPKTRPRWPTALQSWAQVLRVCRELDAARLRATHCYRRGAPTSGTSRGPGSGRAGPRDRTVVKAKLRVSACLGWRRRTVDRAAWRRPDAWL